MIVREATADDIRWISAHLRPEDRDEQFATRFDDDPEGLAAALIAMEPFVIKQIVFSPDDGQPAILIAAWIKSPGVAGLSLMSTPRMEEIARDAHRWGLRRFIPFVLVPNVRVAETRILADHAISRRWVRALGFVEVGQPLPVGKNGEKFVHVAWINPEIPDVLRRRSENGPGSGTGGAGGEPAGG